MNVRNNYTFLKTINLISGRIFFFLVLRIVLNKNDKMVRFNRCKYTCSGQIVKNVIETYYSKLCFYWSNWKFSEDEDIDAKLNYPNNIHNL